MNLSCENSKIKCGSRNIGDKTLSQCWVVVGFFFSGLGVIVKSSSKNEELHYDDEPTHISWDGTKEWCQNNELHRDGDNPAQIGSDGSQAWFQCGKRHRDDGPAVIRKDGSKEWFQTGKRHRDDGPVE